VKGAKIFYGMEKPCQRKSKVAPLKNRRAILLSWIVCAAEGSMSGSVKNAKPSFSSLFEPQK